jgi:hypothetical protein
MDRCTHTYLLYIYINTPTYMYYIYRYGHVAAALDSEHMMIFGGRGEEGIYFNDTWIYNYHRLITVGLF